MKVEELRIGNKILIKGQVDTVTGIFHELGATPNNDIYFVQAANKLDYLIEYCEPIFLTADNLLKCGFEESGFYWWNLDKTFYLNSLGHKFYFQSPTTKNNQVFINSLHQLQNLHFLITSKELKVTF